MKNNCFYVIVTNKPRTKKNRAKKKQPTAHFTHLFFANAQYPTLKNKRVKFFHHTTFN